mmetsp:Transcript_55280/g.155557  ORF Transcript_55280/g.155557 Transcript_55280/m.155557 type:complete len:220 (+) Transcript_55280:2582-3241(+)
MADSSVRRGHTRADNAARPHQMPLKNFHAYHVQPLCLAGSFTMSACSESMEYRRPSPVPARDIRRFSVMDLWCPHLRLGDSASEAVNEWTSLYLAASRNASMISSSDICSAMSMGESPCSFRAVGSARALRRTRTSFMDPVSTASWSHIDGTPLSRSADAASWFRCRTAVSSGELRLLRTSYSWAEAEAEFDCPNCQFSCWPWPTQSDHFSCFLRALAV